MTVPIVRADSKTLHITEKQHQAAQAIEPDVFDKVATSRVHLQLHRDDGATSQLPDELVGIVLAALDAVRNESTLTLAVMPEELTTTAAASLLGISRPTLMKRIRSGDIAAHKVGTHTRLNSKEVLAHRRRQREAQRRAVLEMMNLEDELGDYS